VEGRRPSGVRLLERSLLFFFLVSFHSSFSFFLFFFFFLGPSGMHRNNGKIRWDALNMTGVHVPEERSCSFIRKFLCSLVHISISAAQAQTAWVPLRE